MKKKYISPYKEIHYKMKDSDAVIEVLNDDEIEQQKNIRNQTNEKNSNNERTQKRINNIYQRLFEADNSQDILKYLRWAKNWSLYPNFEFRSFADILETKLPLLSEKERYFVNMAIKSLREHGVIHPAIIDAMNECLGKK